MFAVNRCVVTLTVTTGAQTHDARSSGAATSYLSGHSLLLAGKLRASAALRTTEIAGSNKLLLACAAGDLFLTSLQQAMCCVVNLLTAVLCTYKARQCTAAWCVIHNFVVMLCFKFVYAVFCDIYRWLLLASR